MAKDDDAPQANPMNETVMPGPNEPEARTPVGDAHSAAVTYSEQAEEAKGTQDPYPYDPTNELLDGDDSPQAGFLASRGMRVSDSGRALVPVEDPTGVEVPPPATSNLELLKRTEKVLVANDEAVGLDPEIGRKARRGAMVEAAQARRGASADKPTAQAQSQPPQGRSTKPTTKS